MVVRYGALFDRFAVARSATLIVLVITALGSNLAVFADDLKLQSIAFEPIAANPVFDAEAGKWDTKIRERGWILKDESGWKLWYTGFDPAQQPPMMSPGLATSKDGIDWHRAVQKPIVPDVWIEDMMIVKQDDAYFMFAEGVQDQAQLLRSSDGVHWDRRGPLDVRLMNGESIPAGPFGTPTAFFENGVWNLFYERRDAGIWLARSTDMNVWTNVSDEPLIRPGPEEYDALMIAMNQVIRIDDEYFAVMHGTGSPEKPRQWSTYLATSPDLIHWTKDVRGPLRPASENKSSGQLVHDGRQWRLYTMHDKVDLHLPTKP